MNFHITYLSVNCLIKNMGIANYSESNFVVQSYPYYSNTFIIDVAMKMSTMNII